MYRSSRLHAINPTAAVNEDISYMYTLASHYTGSVLHSNRLHSQHSDLCFHSSRGGGTHAEAFVAV